MKRQDKVITGLTLWTVGSLAYATLAHYAPEGAYEQLGSSLEFVFTMMWTTYFFGVPVLTYLWMQEGEDT